MNADHAAQDSSLPLSPQWLYAKSADAKTFATGASSEPVRHSVSVPLLHQDTFDCYFMVRI